MTFTQKLHNEGPKIFGLFLWFGINFGLFLGNYLMYANDKRYFYQRQLIGYSLPVARASAACLNFNCMLVLLPVCRNLLSLIKIIPCPPSRPRRWIFRVLDKHITFHRTLGQVIGFFTLIHVAAHTINIHKYILGWNPNNITKGLNPTLSALPSTSNGTWLNPVRSPFGDASIEILKLFPGWTGIVITLALILIYSTSTEIIRRYLFEVFWLAHHAFIVFLVGLFFHGFQGVIRYQSNVDLHDPEKCYKYYDTWGVKNSPCPVIPEFTPNPPQTWKWIIAPIILYVIERIIRFCRSFRHVEIVSAKIHKSNVLELVMTQNGFQYLPGQYLFLNCPSVSYFEWHPFTLTSSPSEKAFSVHIRCVGDWTTQLQGIFKKALEDNNDATEVNGSGSNKKKNSKFPRLAVDGPYGSPAEDSFAYSVNVLIGAGIGVTPFVSVLRHIWSHLHVNARDNVDHLPLKKVHFFWLCPDHRQFEWFTEYLTSLERELWDIGKSDFLEILVYLTRGWNGATLKDIVVNDQEEQDCFTGLQAKTHFGRPDWTRIFTALAAEHENQRVGVFFCGPKELSAQLHIACNKFSNVEKGVKFYYNKENF